MNNGGWVKLWRKIDENPIFQRPAYLAVWIDILLNASHNTEKRVFFGGKIIYLEPGQFTAGAYQIGKRRGVPRGTVERIINLFKNEELIEVRSDHQCSLITVKKWAEYQKIEEGNEERVRNERGTSEERMRTNQEVKKLRIKETKNSTRTASPSAPQDDGVHQAMICFYEKINQSLKMGNPHQRKAVQFLIGRIGMDKLLPVIESLATSNLDKFAPKIYTPLALKEKWSALKDYWKRREEDQVKSKPFANAVQL